MKRLALAATLLVCASAAPLTASADTLAWQLIGTNPDIYAPSYPQPLSDDFFHRGGASEPQAFLHPRFSMSFAQLRAADACEQAVRFARALALPGSAALSCAR